MSNLEEAIAHCKEKAEELRQKAGFETDYLCYMMSDSERTECLECANEHEQLADWLTKLDEARKIIWDTSLEDACKIMKLRNLIDYDLGREATNDKTN